MPHGNSKHTCEFKRTFPPVIQQIKESVRSKK